jgi:CDP-glucose 4,6-dehydratase
MVTMLQDLQNTYKGKKVFLTGHTGFKGAWLLKMLNILGAEVKGFALAPQYENDLYNLIGGDLLCESVIADLRNRDVLTTAIIDFQPDFIFHLAAQPLVRLSYEMPSQTFEINAIGTANLLDAVRRLKKKCSVVLITTDKVYHNNEWEYPYRETDKLGGYDPYSASKACTELVIDSYRNSFFNPLNYSDHSKALAVCRAGNVIGGGDWSANRLIPDIIGSLYSNNPVAVRNPKSVRPWQFVLEPLLGYLMLGAKIEQSVIYAEAYNFGPDVSDTLPVLEMVDLAIKNWGMGSYVFLNSDKELHEAGLLKLDSSKSIARLNWKPKYSAATAIEVTINWYKEFYENPRQIATYSANQILSFVNA